MATGAQAIIEYWRYIHYDHVLLHLFPEIQVCLDQADYITHGVKKAENWDRELTTAAPPPRYVWCRTFQSAGCKFGFLSRRLPTILMFVPQCMP